ncbi:hypothetical protein J3R80_06620 [Aliiroseovarius sp. Z3]|uniref:hypothetical protein n=1 Tax=Aliiroseovarius sp. Z3 TaxID=2811402 RepID=UPI0023B3178D|nr:hypothetical protein [Aliiroseovarius sp. Z3]MDE9450140.1 hypothetical protein [Aliiroseovarius sp. Z3]
MATTQDDNRKETTIINIIKTTEIRTAAPKFRSTIPKECFNKAQPVMSPPQIDFHQPNTSFSLSQHGRKLAGAYAKLALGKETS